MATRSPFRVEADVSLEIEVSVSGVFEPGYSGSWNDPGADDCVQVEDIEGLFAWRSNPKHSQPGQPRILKVNLLDGVDIKSPAARRIIQNILEVIEDEATSALFSEADG